MMMSRALACVALLTSIGCVIGEEHDGLGDEGVGLRPNPNVRDMAYAGLLRSNGRFTCLVEDTATACPAGFTGESAVQPVLAAKPKYVRVANAGNELCPGDDVPSCPEADWLLGVPRPGTAEYQALLKLKGEGMVLGIHLNGETRSPDKILDHAQKIRARDTALAKADNRGRFYEWIQVDFAFERAKGDGNRDKLQKILDGLRAQGWLVWANETGWRDSTENQFLGRRVWVHAKRFDLMRQLKSDCKDGVTATCRAKIREVEERALRKDLDGDGKIAGGGTVIVEEDREFLKAIKDVDPNGQAMLKLEVYGQVNLFKTLLTQETQRALLRRWAEEQDCVQIGGQCHKFALFYPLAIPDAGDATDTGTPFHPYVSWRMQAQTYCQQRALMDFYDPPQSGKPAATCSFPWLDGGQEPIDWN